ncbi:MAG: YihY/virulence factor BrkB family protein [Ornithinimicrobium sp.]|uniref:YihY/virulence factor BrkB family protein n=1 Tax=Ornithinimicrobium sp. TaxID=1977084 RepID=UPI003D9ADA17
MSTSTPAPRRVTAKPDVVNSLKRGFAEFLEDGGPDIAATLTYYAVLSLFPAIIALTSLLGVFGQGSDTTRALLDVLGELGVSGDSLTTIGDYIDNLQDVDGASLGLILGLAGALFAASNYVNAFSRAMNKVYGVQEGRPIWKLRPWMVLITLIVLVLVMLVAFSLVFTGGIVEAVGNVVGLGSTAVTVWGIAKWPVMFLVVVGIVGLLYRGTPNVKYPKLRLFSTGALMAIVVWGIATAGFGFYVSQSKSYDATYGALAGVIVLLVWLWITNIVLILGAEIDSELERSRQLRSGLPAEHEIQLPPRDSSGVVKKEEAEQERVRKMRGIRIKAAEGRLEK